MKLLFGADLIDGSGGPVLRDAVVLVDGNRIEDVGPRGSVAAPPGSEEIDLTGLTLLPGLIDTHDHLAHKNYGLLSRWELEEPVSVAHLKTAKAIEDSLAAGYTTIRDAGGAGRRFQTSGGRRALEGPQTGNRRLDHLSHRRHRRRGQRVGTPDHLPHRPNAAPRGGQRYGSGAQHRS